MKKLVFLWVLALPFPVWAQTSSVGEASFGVRVGVAADYKIAKGLHLNLEEEVRYNGSLKRLQTTLGVDYKINKYFKTGASYSLLENYKVKKAVFEPRHRGGFMSRGRCRWAISAFRSGRLSS